MKNELNYNKVNDLVSLGYKILNILFIFIILTGVYFIIILLKELNVFPIIISILKIISPLFIGIVIAWLFDPIVTYLNGKGLRRIIGSSLCYMIFIGIIVLILNSLIPVLSTQTQELVSNTLPAVFDSAENLINNTFDALNSIENFDANSMKLELFGKLESFAANLTSSLPQTVVNILKSSFSGLGAFGIGLIIGFYLLLDFKSNSKKFYLLIPTKYRKETHKLFERINEPLKRFIQGSLIDMLIIFIISAIGFSILGLKAPLLFALFCAITNVIPYAGPYIGGAPAIIVGLTQGTSVGIAIFIFIVVVQLIEGNLIQPYIMSKTTKLNPVLIIVSLLLFGKFFGIIGMVLSTPFLGVLKELISYFDGKYKFLNYKE